MPLAFYVFLGVSCKAFGWLQKIIHFSIALSIYVDLKFGFQLYAVLYTIKKYNNFLTKYKI